MSSKHSILKMRQNYIDKYENMFEDIVSRSANPFAAGYLDGRIVYWNDAFEELTGYNSEELWDMNWIHALTPKKEESLSRIIKGKTKIVRSDRLLRRKDGSLVPIRYTVRQAQYPDEGFILYYGFITDISAEKELQEALHYQNAFKKLLYNTAVRFISLDRTEIYSEISNTLGYIGDFIGADNGFVILLKGNGQGILHTCQWSAAGSQTPDTMLTATTLSDFSDLMSKLYSSHNTARWEYSLALTTAEVNRLLGEGAGSIMALPMLYKTNLLGFLGYATVDRRAWSEQDITLIRIMSEIFIDALGRQKANLRLDIAIRLIDIISEGVMVFTPEKINWVNQTFTLLTGYKFDEVVGTDFFSFNLSLLTDGPIGEMGKNLHRTGKWRGNVTVRRKDGNTFPCLLSINSLHNEKGELACRVAIFTDITGEEKLKQEQLRLQELNAAMQKSASLSAMSAGIVHEIAQPLNSIKMIVEGLRYWHSNSYRIYAREVLDKLDEISEEMRRIDEIIRHMRSFASLSEKPELEACNLNNSVTRTLRLLSRQLAAHGINITTELTEDLPPVNANLNRLDAVLVNLFTNAMQSLDRVEHNNKELICRTYPEADHVVLQIIDNGIGIDEDILDYIFEPFVTTKASRHGMGLGLSVVHTVITRMGGRVIANNNGDGGASFTIKLPPFI